MKGGDIMKVALVHDWLTGMRGGENVLEAFCEMFPSADLYTLVHIPGAVSPLIEDRKIHTSFLQKFPGVEKKYRWMLPLMPRAIESFRLSGYDLVLSSSHCVAKGIRPGGAPHICYCHTPMRYAWDMYGDYFNSARFSALTLYAIGKIMPRLREWDRRTASRVGLFVANSAHVRERIKRIYDRESEIVHPPVDVDYYTVGDDERDFYLIVSAFAPYKRVDLAIELFNTTGEPLVIVGGGEDEARLRGMAAENIRFEGAVPRERLRELYRKAKALIFPGEEDFGIVPVEAMACGAPVIAYGRGGALETVTPLRDNIAENPTGVFFDRQTKDDLAEALKIFESNIGRFKQESSHKNAELFAKHVFVENMERLIENYLASHRS